MSDSTRQQIMSAILQAYPGAQNIPGTPETIEIFFPDAPLQVVIPADFPRTPPRFFPLLVPSFQIPAEEVPNTSSETIIALIELMRKNLNDLWNGCSPLTHREVTHQIYALPANSPLLSDLCSNELCAHGYLSQQLYAQQLLKSAHTSLTQTESSAASNLLLRPDIEALACDVESLQDQVELAKTRFSKAYGLAGPMLDISTPDKLIAHLKS